MLSRCFRAEESRARYWAQQAVELCSEIEDETLAELIPSLDEARKVLDRDRRIIVIGGPGCGKSSLLAAVADYPLIATLPMTDDYVCWRYRSQDGDYTASKFIPLENLEGLELVDTRSCADAAVADSVRRLMKGADVVIAVADGRSPESSPIWSLLAELPEKQRSACLVAITFTERLSADASLALKESLREFCRERVGVPLPLYFVSPDKGSEANETFTMRVQEALAEPCGVRTAIRHLVECAKEMVRRQGSVLGARDRVARTDSGFLAGIEQEIDYFLIRQRDSVTACVDNYSEAAMRALPTTADKLRKTLSWFLSPVTLLRMELLGAGTEKFLYRSVKHEILTQQEASDSNFVLSCMKHWQSVRPRMKKTLECEIGEFPAEALSQELQELRDRMGRALYKPFTEMKLRSEFNKVFSHHVGWMAAAILLICFMLFVAGILGVLSLDFFALCAVVAAGFVWFLGSISHYLAARDIHREIVLHSLKLQDLLRNTIGEAVEGLLVSRVAAYRRLYMAPREKVARHQASLLPLQQRQKEINMQLNAAAPRI